MTDGRGRLSGVLRAAALAALLLAGAVVRAAESAPPELPSVIPKPASLEPRPGSLRLAVIRDVVVPKNADADTRRVAGFIHDWLRNDCGVRTAGVAESARGAAVRLEVVSPDKAAKEAYRLDVMPDGIRIRASDAAGFFYALQTLRQLVPSGAAACPCVSVGDAPRFGWRGMQLDVSRHFFGKEFVKNYIDLLASRKLNVFHWHLVDGPGWRIEIKKHPELTRIGAWRKDKRAEPWNWRATELCFNGKTPGAYGGFYTQEEIREVVRYAKARFVTIIPEIEMPGHSYAVLAACPQFVCEGNNIRTDGLRGLDVFCAGNEGSYKFLAEVLDEVAALFPDAPYIHIGGDEVPDLAWKRCGKCQALMKRLGLRTPRELEAHFIGRIAQHLAAKGRKIIGWDEIAESALPKDAAVMVWRDAAFAKRALAQGCPVVMAPASHLYFDYALSPVPPGDAPSAGKGPSMETVYGFDPAAGLTPAEARLVLGVEACLWTEHVQTEARALEMTSPRLDALAEIAWTKQAARDWNDFRRRLERSAAPPAPKPK